MLRRKTPIFRAVTLLGAGLIAASATACQPAPTAAKDPEVKEYVITSFLPYAQEVVNAIKPANSFLPIRKTEGADLDSEDFLDDHGWQPKGSDFGRNRYTRGPAQDGEYPYHSTSTLWIGSATGAFERHDGVTKHYRAPLGVYVTKGDFAYGYMPTFDFSITYKPTADAATSRVAQFKRVITKTVDRKYVYENTLTGELPAGGSADLTGIIDDTANKATLNGTIVSKDGKTFKISYESQDQMTEEALRSTWTYQVELVDRAKLSIEFTAVGSEKQSEYRVKGALFNNLGQEIATVNEQKVDAYDSAYGLTWKDGRTETLSSAIFAELINIRNVMYDRNSFMYE